MGLLVIGGAVAYLALQGGLLPSGTPTFSMRRDSAPSVYVNGQPARTDPSVRKMERDVLALNAIAPYVDTSSRRLL